MFSGNYATLATYLPALLIKNVGFWLFVAAGVASACKFARNSETRRQGLELISFALPLLAFAVYRDVYPYFFPFILAPLAVLAGFGATRLVPLWRAAGLALIAASAVSAFLQGHLHGNSHQRVVLSEIHRLFPRPVPYIDHTSMVSSYPKQGIFMSTWGMTDYRRQAKPIMQDIIIERQPKFLLVTRALLDVEKLDPTWSQRLPSGLLAEDVQALNDNFVRYWGPIYLPALKLNGAGMLAVRIEGPYRLEQGSSIEIAGRRLAPGETVELKAGNYRFRATRPAVLRWAAPPPPTSAPPARLFDGF
jgi:hypothetical protein